MAKRKFSEDFSCVYPKHNCELQAKQRSAETFRDKLFRPLRNLPLASQKNFRAYWYLRTTGGIQLELTRQKQQSPWYIVHPFSQIRLFWECLMVAVTVVSIIFFPIKAALLNLLVARFYMKTHRPMTNFYIGIVVSLVLNTLWMLDCFGNFITGYYDAETDQVVMDPTTIAKQYASHRFILELTSSVPIESLLALVLGFETLTNFDQTVFICLQVHYIYSTIRFFHYVWYCYKIGSHSNITYLTLRILFAVIVYFWIINWTIYVSLILPQIIYGDAVFETVKEIPLSWSQAVGLYNMTLWEQYKTALLKSVFTNIGVSTWDNMFNVDDYVIAVLICICDRVYFINFLVWFLEAVTAANALRVKFILILDQLKTYMKKKEVPLFLKKRLNRFYYYRFQAHYFRDRAILGRLNPSLRKEISMYTCQKLIHNTEIFQSLPRKVVARLVQRMHREMYFPQDVIVRANTFGECMYFICSGTVAVSTSSDKEICRLEDGEFFGEIALIVEDRRRTATITAVTITEVYRLEAYDYKKIIQRYPDVYNRLEKFAATRFKTLLAMEDK